MKLVRLYIEVLKLVVKWYASAFIRVLFVPLLPAFIFSAGVLFLAGSGSQISVAALVTVSEFSLLVGFGILFILPSFFYSVWFCLLYGVVDISVPIIREQVFLRHMRANCGLAEVRKSKGEDFVFLDKVQPKSYTGVGGFLPAAVPLPCAAPGPGSSSGPPFLLSRNFSLNLYYGRI